SSAGNRDLARTLDAQWRSRDGSGGARLGRRSAQLASAPPRDHLFGVTLQAPHGQLHHIIHGHRFPRPERFAVAAPDEGAVVGAVGPDLLQERPVTAAEYVPGPGSVVELGLERGNRVQLAL